MTIPPPTTEQERQALAERYVLGDPTLDTTEFEALLLEDESLALAVAAAVDELGLIAEASRRLAPTPASAVSGPGVSASSVGSAGGQRLRLGSWSSAALVAACLALIGLGIKVTWPDAQSPNPTPLQAQVDESLEMSQVAESWLAFETAFAEEALRASEPDAVAAVPVPAGGADEDDWLVEAAQLYFAEMESSES